MVVPGAKVSAGQSVMELETDKAVVEVPSSVSGTVQEIRVKEGEKIKVGQVIFTVDGAEAKAGSTASQSTTAATLPAKDTAAPAASSGSAKKSEPSSASATPASAPPPAAPAP